MRQRRREVRKEGMRRDKEGDDERDIEKLKHEV